MITKGLSVNALAKKTKRSAPYIRALVHVGVLDAMETETGRLTFPLNAFEKVLAHEEAQRQRAG